MTENKLHDFLLTRVSGFSSIIYALAILEFAILMVCILMSSNEDIIRIYTPDNRIVYENTYNMSHINEFKTLYGIEDLKAEGFTLSRVEKENRFPTRAWVALSICVPLSITLLVVFIVRVYQDLFHGSPQEAPKEQPASQEDGFQETRFEKLFSTLGRLNIYSLGCTAIVIGFLYWMVPDLLVYVGRISYQTLSELKWVILGVALLVGAYLTLKLILSHKTKTEIIRQQAQIQQNRDRLTIQSKAEVLQLEERNPDVRER